MIQSTAVTLKINELEARVSVCFKSYGAALSTRDFTLVLIDECSGLLSLNGSNHLVHRVSKSAELKAFKAKLKTDEAKVAHTLSEYRIARRELSEFLIDAENRGLCVAHLRCGFESYSCEALCAGPVL